MMTRYMMQTQSRKEKRKKTSEYDQIITWDLEMETHIVGTSDMYPCVMHEYKA